MRRSVTGHPRLIELHYAEPNSGNMGRFHKNGMYSYEGEVNAPWFPKFARYYHQKNAEAEVFHALKTARSHPSYKANDSSVSLFSGLLSKNVKTKLMFLNGIRNVTNNNTTTTIIFEKNNPILRNLRSGRQNYTGEQSDSKWLANQLASMRKSTNNNNMNNNNTRKPQREKSLSRSEPTTNNKRKRNLTAATQRKMRVISY